MNELCLVTIPDLIVLGTQPLLKAIYSLLPLFSKQFICSFPVAKWWKYKEENIKKLAKEFVWLLFSDIEA